MNRLSTERRGQIVGCLTEGMSLRATASVTGASKNTITKLLVDLGEACADYMDATLADLDLDRIECDEIWSFCYSKQKNIPDEFEGTPGYGDVWTWVAIDADTKLVPSWLVGERTQEDCWVFLADLKSRCRVTEVKVQSSDPVESLISTSYVERQNLTMRMGMRRFTRLTNGFSKKVENLAHAVSLHYMHYNFARPHQSLTVDGKKRTPAMAAGKETRAWSLTDIAGLLD